jgi:hypothetical protein
MKKVGPVSKHPHPRDGRKRTCAVGTAHRQVLVALDIMLEKFELISSHGRRNPAEIFEELKLVA